MQNACQIQNCELTDTKSSKVGTVFKMQNSYTVRMQNYKGQTTQTLLTAGRQQSLHIQISFTIWTHILQHPKPHNQN